MILIGLSFFRLFSDFSVCSCGTVPLKWHPYYTLGF